MFCVNCGNPLHENTNYCANCGSPVKINQPTAMKVEDIPYDAYKRIAFEERFRFSYLFLENNTLDEELLYEIFFNATHSMSSGNISSKMDMDAFVAGTLVGCMGSSKEELAHMNEQIRVLESSRNLLKK